MRPRCVIIVGVVLSAVFLSGCKNNVVSTIPSAPVSLEFNILRDAPTLNAIGGVATFVTPKYAYQYLGYGGIVVFHDFEDRFVAFDLACPNEIDPNVRVNVDSIPEAICSKCGAIFDIGYSRGYPIAGECRYPMKQYNVMVANYDVHVYN
ncbi:MAG: hypothetical protein ACI392_02040 [Paludibacteraceae bacterium]